MSADPILNRLQAIHAKLRAELTSATQSLDEAQRAAYAEGRKDEREEIVAAIERAGFRLMDTGKTLFLLNVQDDNEPADDQANTLARAAGKAKSRRFDSEPLTGFGGLEA